MEKISDREVLMKAIDIAMDNGYRLEYFKSIKFSDEINENSVESYNHVSQSIIFSHNFAKAFFGARTLKEKEFEVLRGEEFFKHHLKEMVIEESPIDYLRKFIEDGK